MKSKRLSLPSGANLTSVDISAGSGCFPIDAGIVAPLRTSDNGVSLPVFASFTISVALYFCTAAAFCGLVKPPQ